MKIRLKDILIDKFIELYKDIIGFKVNKLVLKGGRSSTKSCLVAFSIAMGVIKNKVSAACVIKYNNKVEDRLINTFNEMFARTGLGEYFEYVATKREFILLDGQRRRTKYSIKCVGIDNPEIIKSFKSRNDEGFRYIWLEEVTDFEEVQVDSIINTLGRSSGRKLTIYSYNPPKKRSSWLNKKYQHIEINNNVEDYVVDGSNILLKEKVSYVENNIEVIEEVVTKINSSSYLDVVSSGHRDWLGEVFYKAELMKVENPENYRWMYLGEDVGTEGSVFKNIHEMSISQMPVPTKINRGLDYGFTNDPIAYVETYYDPRERKLYFVKEYGGVGITNDTLVYKLREMKAFGFIYADSEDPRTTNYLASKGVKITGVKKGPDSVRYGIDWLQGLNGIYIDKAVTPNVYKEFTEYEYEIDKNEQYTGELPDKNNHYIDATRYAESVDMINK